MSKINLEISVNDIINFDFLKILSEKAGHILAQENFDMRGIGEIERRSVERYVRYVNLIECAKSLDYSIKFISSMNSCMSFISFISIDQYLNYHYEHFISKVYTIRELWYKYFEALMGYKLYKKSIGKVIRLEVKKKLSENHLLLSFKAITDQLENLLSGLYKERNIINHDGKNYNRYTSALVYASLRDMKVDDYVHHAVTARKEMIKDLKIHKYNVYMMLQQLFRCSACYCVVMENWDIKFADCQKIDKINDI